MKTFKQTKTTEEPRLKIMYETDSESPRRQQDNLGYFYTKERNYKSPDGNDTDIYNIMIETGEQASNEQNHIVEMTRRINAETNQKVVAIYPVYRYEHGNVIYRVGTASGFDYSNCGFYIITDKTEREYGEHAKSIEALIAGELEEYTNWVNGDVFWFQLFDTKGEQVDSCGGFYDLDEIKSYLGKEWVKEDLSKYLIAQ